MKSRLLIIIGIIIAIIISVSSLIIIDDIESQSKSPPLTDTSVSDITTLVCPNPLSEKPHEDAVWNLDRCYWFVDDPYIPYELQIVLDDCGMRFYEPDDLLVFTNDTHSIDNLDCQWETPPRGSIPMKTYPPPAHLSEEKELQTALEFCSGKFGIIPDRKTLWINDTHKITSDSCELEKRFNSGISMDRTVYPVPTPEPLDIASIEDGRIRLNPVDTCAGIDIDRLTLDELNQRYPATYTTKSGKTFEIKFLSINDDDLKEMPIISELIRATHQIPFPLNDGIKASKGLVENPDWNNYQEWYDQKKTEEFNLDEIQVRGFVYNEEYYSIGFSIC